MKKLSKKKLIAAAAALVLIVALIIALLPRTQSMPESSVEAVEEIVYGTAEISSITRTLASGGTIGDVDARSISLAGSIKLESWAVNEGDYVEAGQLLATVDKSSVRAAIDALNTLMQELDADIETAKSSAAAATVTAPEAGRVKAVYAEPGTALADTVYENGALMLLSLDGRMAVDIDAGDLTPGAALTVTLSDGSELSGTVFSLSDGTATVTVSNETALPGDTATVSYEGQTLGTGTLYIHREVKVLGWSGTAYYVYPAVNAYVSAGQTLISLTDTDTAAQYASLMLQRRELEQDMQALFDAYERGGIYAPAAGRVSGLNEDAVNKTLSASGTGKLLASFSRTHTLRLLSAVSVQDETGAAEDGAETPPAAETPSPSPSPAESSSSPAPVTPSPAVSPAPSGATVDKLGRVTGLAVSDTGETVLVIALSDGGELRLSLSELAGKTGTVEPGSIKAGDILYLSYDAESGALISATVYSDETPTPGGDDNGGGSMPGGQTGGAQGSGAQGGSAQGGAAQPEGETEKSYTSEKTALCTFTPYDEAEISLSIDELDIARLHVGQSVSVTLDALPGQSFTGEISAIDPEGTNSGGNTKYAVTVTMPRTEQMLTGMNAAISIELETRDGVLSVPAAAICEDAGGIYLCTGYDAKSDALTGPVYITTGISDGENVEVTSGLDAGDSYCYRSAEELKYSFIR